MREVMTLNGTYTSDNYNHRKQNDCISSMRTVKNW